MRASVVWKIAGVIGFVLLTVVAYFLFWPVPADASQGQGERLALMVDFPSPAYLPARCQLLQ